MMGTQNPPLHESRHPMHASHRDMSRNIGTEQDRALMDEAQVFQ